MSGNIFTRRMGEQYDTIFRQCVSLNTELNQLAPLAKKMHLLSSNAISSAARAGSKGDAFRVLTQDIQLLGEEVSACIADTQKVTADIVMLASTLARLFTDYRTFDDLRKRIENVKMETSATFFNRAHRQVVEKIREHNNKLSRNLVNLADLLSPIATLVKKGKYLAVYTSVEAASAGEHGVGFEAVASMLRELVGQLGKQSTRQHGLLRDLLEAMEKQQQNHRNLLYAG